MPSLRRQLVASVVDSATSMALAGLTLSLLWAVTRTPGRLTYVGYPDSSSTGVMLTAAAAFLIAACWFAAWGARKSGTVGQLAVGTRLEGGPLRGWRLLAWSAVQALPVAGSYLVLQVLHGGLVTWWAALLPAVSALLMRPVLLGLPALVSKGRWLPEIVSGRMLELAQPTGEPSATRVPSALLDGLLVWFFVGVLMSLVTTVLAALPFGIAASLPAELGLLLLVCVPMFWVFWLPVRRLGGSFGQVVCGQELRGSRTRQLAWSVLAGPVTVAVTLVLVLFLQAQSGLLLWVTSAVSLGPGQVTALQDLAPEWAVRLTAAGTLLVWVLVRLLGLLTCAVFPSGAGLSELLTGARVGAASGRRTAFLTALLALMVLLATWVSATQLSPAPLTVEEQAAQDVQRAEDYQTQQRERDQAIATAQKIAEPIFATIDTLAGPTGGKALKVTEHLDGGLPGSANSYVQEVVTYLNPDSSVVQVNDRGTVVCPKPMDCFEKQQDPEGPTWYATSPVEWSESQPVIPLVNWLERYSTDWRHQMVVDSADAPDKVQISSGQLVFPDAPAFGDPITLTATGAGVRVGSAGQIVTYELVDPKPIPKMKRVVRFP